MIFNKKGFTLIELLIVIGIIAILAAGVIVAINPGRQFAQSRDATRRSHINTLNNGLVSYQVSNNGNLTELSLPTEPTEICNTNLTSPTCTSLIVLSDLVDEGHINQLPVDPQGSASETEDGTGYFISDDGSLVAENAEGSFIAIGITETEYSGGGGETFACGDVFTDTRDAQTYGTVDIGGQCWMSENLNVGTMLPSGPDHSSDNGTIEKWCYDDSTSNCDTYGGLYDWNEMMQYVTTEPNQGICPTGWHIPTDSEWYSLENYLTDGGNTCSSTREGNDCDPAGGALKEAGTTHWGAETCGTATCNSSGFTAIPGGIRGYTGGFSLSSYAFLWSSSDDGSGGHRRRYLTESSSEINRSTYSMGAGYSVRCLKD
jgi:uncharacterized protein (TIGR02145 family)/prepilin-type N-terminal cleavage/methylation domain-containing protein